MIRFIYIVNFCYCILFINTQKAAAAATDKIKVYFNHPVNTAVATGPHAVYLNHTLADTLVGYIDRAKYSIDVAQYEYSQTTSYASIYTAINNAYTRGIKIRWIYDGAATNTG